MPIQVFHAGSMRPTRSATRARMRQSGRRDVQSGDTLELKAHFRQLRNGKIVETDAMEADFEPKFTAAEAIYDDLLALHRVIAQP